MATSAVTDHHTDTDDPRKPDGVRLLVHAAALAVVSAVCRGFGAVFARIQSWSAEHVCNAESRWVARATSLEQRAFRVIRPWWHSREQFARWSAKRNILATVRLTDLGDADRPAPGVEMQSGYR